MASRPPIEETWMMWPPPRSRSSASIPLQGEGLGDLGEVSHRGSYYACSIGRPAAWWPLAVALILVLRRRRRR